MATTLPFSATAAARRVPGVQIPCYVFDSNHELARHVAQTIAGVIRERQLVRPEGRARPADRLDAGGRLSRADPPAPRRGARFLGRRHVQPRRILRPAARPAAELPPLDARALLQPRQHPAREHPHSRRHRAARRRRRSLPPLRSGDRTGRRHRRAAAGHRPQRAHRLQRAVQPRNSRTRLVTLDPVTRRDAASDFFSEENVPTQAHHDGRGHDPRSPQDRARSPSASTRPRIVREAVEGPLTDRVPASLLREHADATVLVDDGRRRQADRHRHALGAGPRRVDRRDDQAGRALAVRSKPARPCSSSTTTTFASTTCTSLLRHHGPAPERGAARLSLDDGHDRISPGRHASRSGSSASARIPTTT